MHHNYIAHGGRVDLEAEAGKSGGFLIVRNENLRLTHGNRNGVKVAVLELKKCGGKIANLNHLAVRGKLFLAEVELEGTGLCGDLFAAEIRGGGEFALVRLGGDYGLLRLVVPGVVVVGEVVVVGTICGPAKAGNAHIHGTGFHGDHAGVEAHGNYLKLLAKPLGYVLCKGDVEANIGLLPFFARIHKLHGCEIRRGCDFKCFFFGAVASRKGKYHCENQCCGNKFFHFYIPHCFLADERIIHA